MVKTTDAGEREQRWGFLSPLSISKDGGPFLDRLRIVQSPWLGIYLHHIHRPDADAHPHDHPGTFGSLVLAGSYRESVWPDKHDPGWSLSRTRQRFSWKVTNRDAAHMITSVEKPLWTLVITGPRRNGWGFWVDGKLVPWREYLT